MLFGPDETRPVEMPLDKQPIQTKTFAEPQTQPEAIGVIRNDIVAGLKSPMSAPNYHFFLPRRLSDIPIAMAWALDFTTGPFLEPL